MGSIIVFVVFVVNCFNEVSKAQTTNLPINIHPNHSIEVIEGEKLEVNCSVNSQVKPPQSLSWKARGKVEGQITQKWANSFTITLIIKSAQRSDAGFYQCFYNSTRGNQWKGLFIQVNSESKDGARCSSEQFLCVKSKICIFLTFRCNGQKDCPDGSDEENCGDDPCTNKFRCRNGKCIDKALRCDSFHDNHCGDWSDEYDCRLVGDHSSTSGEDNSTSSNNHEEESSMTWLKTTVYSVIGCTVGVVLFISIIVIAVFRIRMQNSVYRQTEREIRRSRDINNRNRRGNRRTNENDSFLSVPPTNYGNIIVNVNNGVQYIPCNELTTLMEAPPSYSDVEREIEERRHSPPPVYSTIDRNPVRTAHPDADRYIFRDSYSPSACAPCLPSLSRGSSVMFDSDSHLNLNLRPLTQNVSVQTSRPSANQTSSCNSTSVQIGTAPNNQRDQSTSQPRNPVVAVREGQIVLSEISAQGQQPCPSHQSSRSGVLQVQDGHIVLEEDRVSDQVRSSSNQSPAHVLQVQGGQILLTNRNVQAGTVTQESNASDVPRAELQTSNQTSEGNIMNFQCLGMLNGVHGNTDSGQALHMESHQGSHDNCSDLSQDSSYATSTQPV